MKPGPATRSLRWLLAVGAGLLAMVVVLVVLRISSASSDRFARLSNLGKGLLEKGDFQAALRVFQQALALEPSHSDAQFNLALALLLAGQNDQAVAQVRPVIERHPSDAGAWYVTGLAHLHAGRFEAAVQALTQAKNIDVTVNAVQFQLGVAYEGWGRLAEAINEWQTLVQFEPDHPSAHYRLSQAHRRLGQMAEAEAALAQHRQVLAKRSGQPITPALLEQCQYTRARLPFHFEPPDKKGIPVVFTDASSVFLAGATNLTGPVGVIDYAQDGRNHLLAREVNAGFRLLLNSNGVFRPHGQTWPAHADSKYSRWLVGDLNNDGVPDALLLGDEGLKLLKFATNGTATDATAFAGLKNVAATDGALVDLDFRGSLDLVAVSPGGAGVRVLRNLGNLYFTDRTVTSGVPATVAAPRQVAVEDWNNDELQDLFIGREGQPPLLLTKLRGGPLTETNSPSDWPAGGVLAVGDLNNDLKPDLAVAGPTKIEIVFAGQKPRAGLAPGGLQPTRLFLLDYDNDGWLDVFATGNGVRAWRNRGPAGFRDTSAVLGLDKLPPGRIESLAAADLDNDGDTDLALSIEGRGLRVLRNDGGNANLQFKAQLQGRRSNASGLGIRLEVSAGGLRLARRIQSLPVEIGVGRHAHLDSVNAHWFTTSPSFVDVKVDPKVPLQLMELTIQEGSCPYLYAWDGARFRFVTDILGTAPLGLPFAEGHYIQPDPDELAWIGNDTNFKPRDGHYVLQVTEELREVLYLDEAKLVVADHPVGTEIHPTSKMLPGPPYPPPELLTLQHRRPLRHATRLDGENVTAALAETDGRFVSPPRLRTTQLRGLAEPHGYVLDFGPLEATRPLVVALTGWLRLGGGMANIAAADQPDLPFPYPRLEAETSDGAWQPLEVAVGVPCGKTKTILVDLSGKLSSTAKRLRLSEAFELHWDRIALFEKADPGATTITRLAPNKTDLHWRGFSQLADLPWFLPLTPVYERIRTVPLFTLLPAGWCTRYGPVDELLSARDNALVLVNAGDELTLRFAADQCPPQPPGTVRDFFLLSSGWDKDADFHVRCGTSVEPLPWHGMDGQRYGRQPRPAFTNDAWMHTWNTRWVGPRFLSRKQ